MKKYKLSWAPKVLKGDIPEFTFDKYQDLNLFVLDKMCTDNYSKLERLDTVYLLAMENPENDIFIQKTLF